MKNQQNLVTFRYLDLEGDDNECDISDIDLYEGCSADKVLSQASLNSNMEYNSFSKFERKIHILKCLKKSKSHGDYPDDDAKLIRLNLKDINANQIDISINFDKNLYEVENGFKKREGSSYSNKTSKRSEKPSLKDEVSMLLRALIDSKKKNKLTDVSDLEASPIECIVKDNNIKSSLLLNSNTDLQEDLITMRNISPVCRNICF